MTNSTNAGTHALTFSLRRLGLIGSVAFFALFIFLWSVAPARANLAAAGPVEPVNAEASFPRYFEDSNGLRLLNCLDGLPNCLAGADELVPADGESFYWLADANPITTASGNVNLRLGLEAAFAGEGAGQEVVFQRVRFFSIGGLAPGGTYTVTHPYGSKSFTADGGGTVTRAGGTSDVGCLGPPCGTFAGSLNGPIGPFLTWDTYRQPVGAPPAGYIGDNVTPHAVTGSPTGNNVFRVQGPGLNATGVDKCPTVDGPITDCVETNLFIIQGKVTAGPTTPDLDPLSDSGASQVDNITNDTTPTFTASATAGNNVNIYDGATLIGSTVASSPSGVYSFTVPVAGALAEGPHAISATETDPLNPLVESAHSPSLSVTVDVTAAAAPALAPDLLAASDTGSSSTDDITNDTTPTFTGNAEANATVNILVGGVSSGSGAGSAAGSYSITTSALTGGVKSITATATDVAGNESDQSGALGIVIDSTAPTSPGLAALSSFSLGRSISLKWSASSEGGSGLAGYSLSYQRAAVRGPSEGSTQWANNLATTSAVFPGVPGSSYCFSVGATDKAGNSSAASSQGCTAVPLDDRALAARGGGWARKFGPGHFLGTYTMGAKSGAQLVLNGIQAKRLGVLVTTCPGCGTLKAYWDGVAVKTIDLNTGAIHKKRLVSLRSFPSVRTGNLVLRIVSPNGEQVIIDGVASSRM